MIVNKIIKNIPIKSHSHFLYINNSVSMVSEKDLKSFFFCFVFSPIKIVFMKYRREKKQALYTCHSARRDPFYFWGHCCLSCKCLTCMSDYISIICIDRIIEDICFSFIVNVDTFINNFLQVSFMQYY